MSIKKKFKLKIEIILKWNSSRKQILLLWEFKNGPKKVNIPWYESGFQEPTLQGFAVVEISFPYIGHCPEMNTFTPLSLALYPVAL